MARHHGIYPVLRACTAAGRQRELRLLAPLVVEDVPVGRTRLRAVERRNDMVGVDSLAAGARGGDRCGDILESCSSDELSLHLQARSANAGLYGSDNVVDRDRIHLLLGRGHDIPVAYARTRLLGRRMGRAVVQLYGRLRRLALGAAVERIHIRSTAHALAPSCGGCRRGGRPACDHLSRTILYI